MSLITAFSNFGKLFSIQNKTAPLPTKGSMYVKFLFVISYGNDFSISVMSCVFPPAHFKNGFADLSKLFFIRFIFKGFNKLNNFY